ncbi:hypothetical protein PMAYCL1PPCAC_08635, partial [Pristionchus mayeri]
RFPLSRIHEDYEVFCSVDDSILQMISSSNHPDLEKAKGYLKAIAERNLARRVAYVECSPNQNEMLRDIGKQCYKVAKNLQDQLTEEGKADGVIDDDVYVISRCIYSGLDGYRHPMSEALVYDNKEADPKPRRLDNLWLDFRASRHTTMVSFALYLSRALSEDTVDRLRDRFEKALANYGIEVQNRSNEGPSPKKRRENNN